MNSRDEITWKVATISELLASDVAGQDDIWKFKISPLLLQASATLLASQFHFVFELQPLSLPLRKILKTDKAFLCFTGYLLAQSRDTEWCISLHNFWRGMVPKVQWVQAGTVHAPRTLLNWYYMKKALPRIGTAWEKSESLPHGSVSWGWRNSPKHITVLSMDEKSFPLPCKVTGHAADWRETCFAPKSTSVLNGRLCPQPQWSHPQRKHWAPKHFQAVNSWILLTRGSSNI